MKKYQYILLDWDGNLAQTLDIWLKCLKIPLQQRGHTFTDKEIGADFSLFSQFGIRNQVPEIDAIIAEAERLATLKTPDVLLYPDVKTTLELLKGRNKKIAIVSTSVHAQIDPLIKKYELGHLVDAVVCGDDVAHIKPHPEPLQLALTLLGGTPQEAIMVGDSDKDIEGAYNAGLDSVLFYPAQHAIFYDLAALQALGPTYQIAAFEEIITLI